MGINDSSRLLLVEGVPGIGKSTLINSLIRKYVDDSRRIRSLLHLTQAHTYFPLSPDEFDSDLMPEQNLAHLDQILNLLRWMVTSVSYERRKIFFCAIDTLHLTHCCRPGILCWDDVSEFDRRMAQLGCKIVFLRAAKKTIWERTIWSRKDNEFITYYGRKYGDSLESIHHYYVQEQERMLANLEQSTMEKLILDCDGAIWDASPKAFDFWMK
jgi:GTPase SAR1 family protein